MSRPGPVVILRTLAAAAAVGVIALAVVALTTPASDAAPAKNCTYYSSGSYTTVVGQYGYDCCNNYVAWGIKTKFARCGGCFICYPPPR